MLDKCELKIRRRQPDSAQPLMQVTFGNDGDADIGVIHVKKNTYGNRKGHNGGKRGLNHLRIQPTVPKQLGNYKTNERIGSGGFAIVYKAVHVESGDTVAIKTIKIHKLNSKQRKQMKVVESEVNLLASLQHTNIVKFIETVETDRFFCIVLEYMEQGSLLSYFKIFGQLSEGMIAAFIIQVLCGLQFLYEQGIIHRDIKAV